MQSFSKGFWWCFFITWVDFFLPQQNLTTLIVMRCVDRLYTKKDKRVGREEKYFCRCLPNADV